MQAAEEVSSAELHYTAKVIFIRQNDVYIFLFSSGAYIRIYTSTYIYYLLKWELRILNRLNVFLFDSFRLPRNVKTKHVGQSVNLTCTLKPHQCSKHNLKTSYELSSPAFFFQSWRLLLRNFPGSSGESSWAEFIYMYICVSILLF